jgi:hypothetical protein
MAILSSSRNERQLARPPPGALDGTRLRGDLLGHLAFLLSDLPLDLLETQTLGFWHLLPEIRQSDQRQNSKQEERSSVGDGVEQREKGCRNHKVAPQFAMVATLIDNPRTFSG